MLAMEIDSIKDSLLPRNKGDVTPAYQVISTPKKDEYSTGLIFLSLSALCSGFGNSLEPITTCTWLIVPFLLVGVHLTLLTDPSSLTSTDISKVLTFITLSQAMGFTIGFLTMFTLDEITWWGVLATFLMGSLLWFFVSVFAVLALVLFVKKYESSVWALFIFPITFTAVLHTLVGRIFSTFPSIANAVLDYAPIRQLASVVGVAGITFVVSTLGSAMAASYLYVAHPTLPVVHLEDPIERSKLQSSLKWIYGGFVILTIVTGLMIQADSFYQKDVSTQIVSHLNVSCIFGTGFNQVKDPELYQRVWSHSAERLAAEDSIVMWSEEAISITSDEQEAAVIKQAQELVLSAGKGHSFLGITYQKRFPLQTNSTNMFVLIEPTGKVAWRYQKSHPVPIVEAGVERGPPIVPYYDTSLLRADGESLRLGGGICFDLDYPTFIRQAGGHKVDLFLQPSWDWKAISTRHFEGDALRPLENGFNMFRCCSDGESGVMNARGQITGRKFTGHDPNESVLFNVPLHARVDTIYNAIGFTFEWFIAGFTVVIWAHLVTK